ncbi:MAG: urease accessory protein [Bermanella sp.]|jgi:urease accessory protein
MKYLIGLLAVLTPALGLAHSGHDNIVMSVSTISNSMTAGFLHPLLGLDHLLSLVAVGILASRLNGKHRYLIPIGFVSLMLIGFFTAHAGIHMVSTGSVEMLITLSLAVAALLVLAGKLLQVNNSFNVIFAWVLTTFASIHGMAHGLEVPAGASATMFALGFALACLTTISVTIISTRLIAPVEHQQAS